MKLRTLFITVALLAVLSAIVYFVQRPAAEPSVDPRLGQPLVDSATVEKAQRLRVSEAGKSVLLVRLPDGTWHVPAYYDLPADFTKLSRFVGELTDAKIQRLVTTSPERIARLEFKDTKIELLDAADKPLWSLTLGKSQDSGGRFARFGDEPKAYLVNLNAWLDPEAKSWADTQILDVKADTVARLEVPFPGGPVVFSRAKAGEPWTSDRTPAGQRPKAERLAGVLSSVGSIRFSDTADRNDPLVAAAQPHTRTFRLTTFDGKTYTVGLSRKPEEKKLKAPAAASDGTTGPAALGSVKDAAKPGDQKPLAPEFETIPAGPVVVQIASSDAAAPVNGYMQKRAFEVAEYVYTVLPETPADLFEAVPPPPAAPAEKKDGEKK